MKPTGEICRREDLVVERMDNHEANEIVTEHHYLHRPIYLGMNVSYSVRHKHYPGIGTVMYGYPVFHTKYGLVGSGQPLRNGELVELCRLWLPDGFPTNSESCAIGKSIAMLRGDWYDLHILQPWRTVRVPDRPVAKEIRDFVPDVRAIISFADTEFLHSGAIYAASNFTLLGWAKGRKATPGQGQGRWAGAKEAKVGQKAGVRKNAYLLILDRSAGIDVGGLKETYRQ